ncbi:MULTISPECIES: VOC family protein [unclassified Streptomyces]|uniref:VOC family protein n=1 Tax=unclassified Streptomyces TaxID=2593676 RepID=UPI002030CF5E|nr:MULTISPECIES: VOC family protein [unclassified Streptomyces]MCM1973508.1 VOC family protein [Streptomyces sp. G1]
MGVDPTGAKEFYTALLGWEFRPEGGRGYHLILLGGEIVGGLGPSPMGPRFGSSWNVYLAAKDLDAAGERAERHGARLLARGVPAGGDGRLSLAVDPQGAPFGLWQGMREEGVVLVDEPGALAGAVLHSPEPEDSAAFYGAVCGSDARIEKGSPARWMPLLGADAPDAFEERARAAGATVLAPGVLADPWGAVFGVADVAVPR